jgi:protein-S-isoprenylcysteine O-methyltransferase Ste14
MSDRANEIAGKTLLALVFCAMLYLNTAGLVGMLRADPRPAFWVLDVTAQMLSMGFVGLVVFLTIRRMPPRSTAHGLAPRFAAIAGTFALMALIFLPVGEVPLFMRIIATGLILVGTLGSIWCLYVLGRSFSIVAQARKLVTSGPYGIVRHPLYFTEGITTIGIIIMHWSAAALALGLVQFALQFWRMGFEEQVLRGAFPEYEDYAERVGMIWPRWQAIARSANG